MIGQRKQKLEGLDSIRAKIIHTNGRVTPLGLNGRSGQQVAEHESDCVRSALRPVAIPALGNHTRETMKRIGFGYPAWIRTMNNASKGRCVTVTPRGTSSPDFRFAILHQIAIGKICELRICGAMNSPPRGSDNSRNGSTAPTAYITADTAPEFTFPREYLTLCSIDRTRLTISSGATGFRRKPASPALINRSSRSC